MYAQEMEARLGPDEEELKAAGPTEGKSVWSVIGSMHIVSTCIFARQFY